MTSSSERVSFSDDDERSVSDNSSSISDGVQIDNTADITGAEAFAERKKRFAGVRITDELGTERAHHMQAPRVPCVVQFEELTFTIKVPDPENPKQMMDRKLLSGVSGNVKPGEFLSLMGPTGSGKTTLLNVLGERITGSVTGKILINGQEPSKDYKRQLAFVTQDDVFLSQLTVYQTLWFQAQLRMGDKSDEEKREKVEELITALGLEHARDTVMGGGIFSRGISGGESKRVNIGNELLSHPSILLLDEPTSGLDTSTAIKIMQLLRSLANTGFTIIAAIHQPSSQMFKLFDKLMVLVEGETIYYGKARDAVNYFAGIGLQCDKLFNPADFMMGLILEEELENKGKSKMKKYLIKSWDKTHGEEEFSAMKTSEEKKLLKYCKKRQEEIGTPTYTTTYFEQLRILTNRSFTQIRRDLFDPLDFIQTFVLAFICGFLWYNIPNDVNHLLDRLGALFFIAVFMGFIRPAFQAVIFFPAERAVILRERRSGAYRLSAYYFAKFLSALPVIFLHPFLFMSICYPMIGLNRTFSSYILLLVITFVLLVTSDAMGTMVSALTAPKLKSSTVGTSILVLSMMLVGGLYVNLFPYWLRWVKFLSPFTFAYQAYLLNELVGSYVYSPPDIVTTFSYLLPQNETTGLPIEGYISGDDILATRNIDMWNIGYHIAVLIGYGIFFRALGFVFLWRSMKYAPV